MRGIQGVVDRVQQELNAIKATQTKVQEQLNLVLTLQNKIHNRTSRLRGFDAAQSGPPAVARHLFERDGHALWEARELRNLVDDDYYRATNR